MTTFGFVHLEYGPQYRQQSLRFLRLLERTLVGSADQARLIIVDNASAAQPAELAGWANGLQIGGDNSNREFSGWDRGVAAYMEQAAEPDVWIFTNDTVAVHHAWSERRIRRFGHEIKHLVPHASPWLLGEINNFPRSTMTPLGPLLEWVATYCFAMNGALRASLQSLSPDNSLLDSLVHGSFEPARALFRDTVDAAYVDFVCAWLIQDVADPSRSSRFKWARQWHKVSPLSAQNFDDLRMKARCCLSESMLSIRARQCGAEIRSPYEARNARDHVTRSWQLVTDRLAERYSLRRSRKTF